MVRGHRGTNGYSRYDKMKFRMKELQMKAVVLLSNPSISYDKTLMKGSKEFVNENLIGNVQCFSGTLHVRSRAFPKQGSFEITTK